MSTQAIPQVSPRPARENKDNAGQSNGSMSAPDMPKIPARPNNRQVERSMSPHRDSFARSPLNEPAFVPGRGSFSRTSVYQSDSANNSNPELAPHRPASVAMPSIGQEGNEYSEIFDPADEARNASTQQVSVANDLMLHAPKPSLPAVSAKQRVSTVTRTDSGQAAALGIGRAQMEDLEPVPRSLKSKTSSLSMRSNNNERRQSIAVEEEHGIPEIGQQVPMYPNAGDVQAPSPSPYAQNFPAGVGFHNDGSKPRHHGRRASAKGFDHPPGSYGLHGHGVVHNDRFEKAYYEKHPELLKRETGHYSGALGDGPREWALSSDELNKIVHDTARGGVGFGASPAYTSTPSDQIAFLASEEYASRKSSPRPNSAMFHKPTHSNVSQTHVDSPLRKESMADEVGPDRADFEGSMAHRLQGQSETALESEAEDDDVVHVDAPARRINKIFGGAAHADETEDLGPRAGNTDQAGGFVSELGYGTPILASDEVAKEPFGYELQPAVSPVQQRLGHSYDPEYALTHVRTNSASSSVHGSRPGSIHGSSAVFRHASDFEHGRSTPLEDLEEYEPLFDEDDENAPRRPQTAADKLKARPDLRNRKFPSQDIWEDTPASLQYTATVSTPQAPDESSHKSIMKDLQIREGESAAQAFARRQEELAEKESQNPESFLHPVKQPWSKSTDVVSEARPNVLKQRFPSRDIWEDNPDSLNLQTTVTGPQSKSLDTDPLSPPDERPTTGGVTYHQEKSAAGIPLGSEEGRATTGLAATMVKPPVPARPTKQKPTVRSDVSSTTDDTSSPLVASRSPEEARPSVPDRPKPQVPVRPSKPLTKPDAEQAPLSKVDSASSAKSIESEASAKPKPSVPSRPVGSKIAALQGGFMSDLNKRLQLGPQAPKKEEPESAEAPEEDKAPLADARKSRARGPARRAPASSSVTEDSKATDSKFVLSTPQTIWHIHPDDGQLNVASTAAHAAQESERDTKAAHDATPTLATNTAGEALHAPFEVAPGADKASSLPSASQDARAQDAEAERKIGLARDVDNQSSSPVKASDEPPVTTRSTGSHPTGDKDVDDEGEADLSGSTATIKPSHEATAKMIDSSQQTGEYVINTNTAMHEDSAPTGTKERLHVYLGGQAPEAGDVAVKESLTKVGHGEPMPGSFEHQ